MDATVRPTNWKLLFIWKKSTFSNRQFDLFSLHQTLLSLHWFAYTLSVILRLYCSSFSSLFIFLSFIFSLDLHHFYLLKYTLSNATENLKSKGGFKCASVCMFVGRWCKRQFSFSSLLSALQPKDSFLSALYFRMRGNWLCSYCLIWTLFMSLIAGLDHSISLPIYGVVIEFVLKIYCGLTVSLFHRCLHF